MAIGLVLRQWAIAVLGRFFTLTVKVQSHHTLVESGPYRLLRHPSYTVLLLVTLGIPLALQTLPGVIVNLIIFGGLSATGFTSRKEHSDPNWESAT